ncbi:MAG: prepilin-type N-terminal cleavage/methylation domain-containing protein [Pontiellaceae bacterium]|nr:prepilin-type N-terminal cleavage/methylation domain-containing protein [Pontiellaceae bacterium]MBN2786068.1 prepilin-type N-terminal cleavage/methylation domain-containing protein [Pontiellaceae bacterium]
MSSDKKKRAGVSLVEVLIAVALISVAASGAAKLVVSTKRLGDTAMDRRVAVQLIRNRVERMDLSDFSDLDMWSVDRLIVDESGVSDSAGRYRLTTEVTHPYTNLAQVYVKVETKDRMTLQFGTMTEEVTTYLSNL